MKPIFKRLILAFTLISLIKIILSLLIPAPSMWSDEFFYVKIARSIFFENTISTNGILVNAYPPLYSLILSITYLFNNMVLTYSFMKIINVLVSTLIIFPTYLLVKEFLKEQESFLVSLMITLIPANFVFSAFILSENFYFPLFMLTIYLLFKSYTKNEVKWDILAGLCTGLLLLLRNITIALVLAVIAISIFKIIINKKRFLLELKKKSILGLTFIITISPWILRNIIQFGFSLNGLMGSYSDEITRIATSYYSVWQFLLWILPYFAALILGTGIIFAVLSLGIFKLKNNKSFNLGLLTLFSSIFFILIAAHHSATSSLYTFGISGKAITRYIECLFPLIILTGAIVIKNIKENKSLKEYFSYFIIYTIILLSTPILLIYSLLPVNNISLTYIGILNQGLQFLFSLPISILISTIIIILLPLLIYVICKKLNFKKIIIYFTIFFILVGLINFGLIYYNSNKYWKNNDMTELGLWLNNQNLEGTILIDKSGCSERILKTSLENTLCDETNGASLISFWINNQVRVDSIDNLNSFNYVITKQELDLPLIQKTKNNIFVYKTMKK